MFSVGGTSIMNPSMFQKYLKEIGYQDFNIDTVNAVTNEFRFLSMAIAGYFDISIPLNLDKSIEVLKNNYMAIARNLINRSGIPGSKTFHNLQTLFKTEVMVYVGEMGLNDIRNTLIREVIVSILTEPDKLKYRLFGIGENIYDED